MIDITKEPTISWEHIVIPKKSGGLRHLYAPNEELKKVQEQILEHLYHIPELRPTRYAHGFAPFRNIVSGAQMHDMEAPVIINIDVHNFFPSFPIERIKEQLMKSRLKPSEISYILKYCVYRYKDKEGNDREQCPQGAPTSPYLTNIGMKPLDYIIAKFAKHRGYTYSRYADDITLAADKSNPLYNPNVKSHRFIIEGLRLILRMYNLHISWDKVSVVYKNSPRAARRVTGVNLRQDGKGYNARRPTRHKGRCLCHILWYRLNHGELPENLMHEYMEMMGTIEFCDYVRKYSKPGFNSKDPCIDKTKFNYIQERFGTNVRR